MNWRARRHCPHPDLRGIFGDEITHTRGYRRLQCRTCGKLLDGPVELARTRSGESGRLTSSANGEPTVGPPSISQLMFLVSPRTVTLRLEEWITIVTVVDHAIGKSPSARWDAETADTAVQAIYNQIRRLPTDDDIVALNDD